jgi:ELWxxDGT repeat protein
MNVRLIAAAALAIAVSALPLGAQTPYLVADINATSTGQRSSNPGGFQAFGDTLFFNATDAQGTELWKYSGGVASRVADIASGSASSSPFGLMDIGGGVQLFRAQNGAYGSELWRTDGTAAGTSLVKDIHPTGHGLVGTWRREVFNGRLFFAATDGVHGIEPWVSDGTAAGTEMLLDLDNASTSSNPALFTVLGNKLLIFGANGMWSSDGTSLGTTFVATVGAALVQGRIGNTIYFTGIGATTGRELWKTDGTAAGTQPVADVIPGPADGLSTNSLLVPIGSTLYFSANRSGGGVDLWKTDGTAGGTQFISTLSTETGHRAWAMFALGNLLMVESNDSIWRSDGTAAGTYVLDSGATRLLVPAFGRAYYYRDGATSSELRSTDGATTQFAATVNSPLGLFSTGGKLYFSASEVLYGQEPWVSEAGTAATTHRLANVYPDAPPSSSPTSLTAVGDLLFFRANDGVTNQEIWRSNGTTAGTFRVTSLIGSGSPTALSMLTAWNGALYFQQSSKKLWRSDGTADGTVVMKDVTGMPPQRMFPGGGYLFFGAGSLWRTDGTADGTIPLGDLLPWPLYPSEVTGFAELAGRVFVTGYETGGWSTDGSPASTKYLFGKNPLMTEVSPAAAAGAFFFVATTAANGRELWRTDGIGGSELLVKDIAAGNASSDPGQLTAGGRFLYFVANDAVHGVELWRTDGTAAGTILLGDIAAGTTSSAPANLTAAGEWLYFTANDGSHGVELWRTDGTALGTVMVSDLRADSASADPGSLKFAGGTLWFAATDGVTGRELWRVTGVGMPSLVADLVPGPGSSSPAELMQAGQLLYFAAETEFGRELWAMPLTASPSLRVDDARISEGTGGTRTIRFTVTRTGSVSGAAGAAFTTVNGSATAGADYVAQSGTVAFTAGQTSRFIDVVVQADAVVEENEGFFVTLSAPSGATISRDVATGVIDDDDHRAELSIVPVIDAGGLYDRVFRITNAGPSAANDLRVRYSESPGELSLEMNDRCTAAENPLTCSSFGTLAAGASIDVTVERGNVSLRQFDEDDPRPGLTVTASVSATELDTNPADSSTARMISMEYRIIAPPYLTSGTAAAAQVFFYNAYPHAVTVALTSSVAGVVVTPPSVSIPSGQSLAQFTVTAGNYTGPVTLTMPALTNFYYASSMTLYVVAPGQVPKLASSMVVGNTTGIYGTPIVTPVTIAARRHDGTKPTGLVSLLNDAGDVLAQHSLDAAGMTAFEFEGLQPGSRFYRLRYHGDANFLPLQDARFEVTVRPWPTTLSVEDFALICSGVPSEIYIDVKTTQTTTAPTGSVQVTAGGVVEMLPLSPTGTPGHSRAILRRPFPADSTYVSVYYIPTGTFGSSNNGAHILAQPCTVLNVVATGIAPGSVGVTWSPVAGATYYEVLHTSNTDNWQAIGTTTSTALVDGGYPWAVAHLYTVRAFNALGQDIGWGVPDIGISMLFADDPLIPNVTPIRGIHNQQVRGGIEGMRHLGYWSADITKVPVTPPGTIVSAAGIMALRAEITTLRRGLGLPQFVFTDPALTAGMPMKAIHMQELRDAVK